MFFLSSRPFLRYLQPEAHISSQQVVFNCLSCEASQKTWEPRGVVSPLSGIFPKQTPQQHNKAASPSPVAQP